MRTSPLAPQSRFAVKMYERTVSPRCRRGALGALKLRDRTGADSWRRGNPPGGGADPRPAPSTAARASATVGQGQAREVGMARVGEGRDHAARFRAVAE